jgi:hypothetical protein
LHDSFGFCKPADSLSAVPDSAGFVQPGSQPGLTEALIYPFVSTGAPDNNGSNLKKTVWSTFFSEMETCVTRIWSPDFREPGEKYRILSGIAPFCARNSCLRGTGQRAAEECRN